MPLRADVRAILTRAMKARKRLDKLARTLKRRFRAGDSLSPRQLRTAAKTVATSGYHGAQLGMKDFDQFLTFLQSGELQPLEFGKRSAEEMAALRQAWDEGVGKAEKAGVAIKPGSANKPAQEDDWDGDTELDADPAGAKASTDQPLADPLYSFRTKAEVRAAVMDAMNAIRGDMPRRWDLVKKALEASRWGTNRAVAARVDAIMAALRNPENWADVIVEAWERAASMNPRDIRRALIDMATERIGPPLTTDVVLEGSEFFDGYVVTGRPIIDKALESNEHRELSHLIQDLVVDHALGADTSSQFRVLLRRVRGTVKRNSEFGNTANEVFPPGEEVIKTGDFVVALHVRPALQADGAAAAAPT